MNSDEGEKRTGEAYAEYLMLPQILSAQRRRSALEGEPVHDETLFIVMHQTLELWFFQIIEELTAARQAVMDDRLDDASQDLVRVSRIFGVLTLSWDVLSTLRVREFWKFRKHFLQDDASGLQSKNFRIVEFLLGVGPRPRTLGSGGEGHERSLWDEVNRALARIGTSIPIPDALLNRNCAVPYPHSQELQDGKIGGDPAVEARWLEVYSEPARYRDIYRLGEHLLDVAGAVAAWRFKHIATVQRFIGDLQGSGKTSGVEYLRKTLARRAFPELWSVRNRFGGWIEEEPVAADA